jgi:hypothetical protein
MKMFQYSRTTLSAVAALFFAISSPAQTTAKGAAGMTIHQIQIERFSIVSSRPFDEVVTRVDRTIGHPDMAAFRKSSSTARTETDLEEIVNKSARPSGLMEFARFDLGAVVRLETGASTPKVLRLVVGNPLIMKQMVRYVPDAGSYDRMATFLAPYNNPQALQIARDLDHKVEALLTEAAR